MNSRIVPYLQSLDIPPDEFEHWCTETEVRLDELSLEEQFDIIDAYRMDADALVIDAVCGPIIEADARLIIDGDTVLLDMAGRRFDLMDHVAIGVHQAVRVIDYSAGGRGLVLGEISSDTPRGSPADEVARQPQRPTADVSFDISRTLAPALDVPLTDGLGFYPPVLPE